MRQRTKAQKWTMQFAGSQELVSEPWLWLSTRTQTRPLSLNRLLRVCGQLQVPASHVVVVPGQRCEAHCAPCLHVRRRLGQHHQVGSQAPLHPRTPQSAHEEHAQNQLCTRGHGGAIRHRVRGFSGSGAGTNDNARTRTHKHTTPCAHANRETYVFVDSHRCLARDAETAPALPSTFVVRFLKRGIHPINNSVPHPGVS